MAKKLTLNDINHLEQNARVDESPERAVRYWNSKILAFEWWEPAPDGFCSSPKT